MMSSRWIECIMYVVSRRRYRNKVEFPEVYAFRTFKKYTTSKRGPFRKLQHMRKSEMH